MQQRRPRVLAFVLNWNDAPTALTCLGHLWRQTLPPDEGLVLDNGSTDDSVERLGAVLRPPWRLATLPRNVGVTRALNLGLREGLRQGFDYLWLLNNDAFAEPDCLERLVALMQSEPRVMIATPRLLVNASPDGIQFWECDGGRVEQHAGGVFNWSRAENRLLPAAELTGPATWGTWLTGTAWLVRLACLSRVGLFDSRFFAYWEDADLCVRAVKCGYDLRAVPEASCLHLRGASHGDNWSPFCAYLMARNQWLFLRKYLRPYQQPEAFLRLVSAQLDLAWKYAYMGHSEGASAKIAALVAILRGETGRPARLSAPALLERALLPRCRSIRELLLTLARRLEVKNGRLETPSP